MNKWILSVFLISVVSAIDMKISGNKLLNDEYIKQEANFPNSADIDEWNNAVKRLYKTGWFDKITITVDDGIAHINIVEYPTLIAYKIDSKIEQLKPEKIIQMLEHDEIRRGKPLRKHHIEQWRLGSIKELQRMGYADSTVDIKIVEKTNGVILEVFMDAKEATLVNHLVFTGHTVLPIKNLKAIANMPEDSIWRRFDSANRFSPSRLDLMAENLKQYYESYGYFNTKIDIKVVNQVVKFNKQLADILINIDAGPISNIQKIEFIGQCGDTALDVSALLGKPFVKAEILQILQRMLPASKIHLNPVLNEYGLDVFVVCNTMPPLVIRNIEVIGDGTDDLLLRKLLDFDEGDQWRSSWVGTSTRRLLGQSFISNANITLTPTPNNPLETDVQVLIAESEKNTMASFRLNYEQNAGLSFGGGFSNRNFLGTGNSLSLDAQYGQAMWFTDLQLSQPLLPYNHSALMGFSFKVTNQDKLNLGPYKQDVATAYYGYRWLLNDDMLLQSQINLLSNHFIVYTSDSNAAFYQDLNKFGYDPTEFSWSNTVIKDTRDRAERTTSGYVNKFSLAVTVPVFSHMMAYLQMTPSVTGFYKFGTLFNQDLVLRGHAQFGYGCSYGEHAGDLPFYSRYYAGGIGTVRGYDLYSLGPFYIDNYSNHRATGGNWLLVGNVDLLLPSPYPEFLQPSLFIDTGNVYIKGIHLDELRYSTGISMAINTPFAQFTITLAKFFNASTSKHRTFTIEMGRQF